MRLIDTAWGVSVLVKLPSCLVRQNRGGFAAIFACLRGHFPVAKIFYDLRLDLRFVW